MNIDKWVLVSGIISAIIGIIECFNGSSLGALWYILAVLCLIDYEITQIKCQNKK